MLWGDTTGFYEQVILKIDGENLLSEKVKLDFFAYEAGLNPKSIMISKDELVVEHTAFKETKRDVYRRLTGQELFFLQSEIAMQKIPLFASPDLSNLRKLVLKFYSVKDMAKTILLEKNLVEDSYYLSVRGTKFNSEGEIEFDGKKPTVLKTADGSYLRMKYNIFGQLTAAEFYNAQTGEIEKLKPINGENIKGEIRPIKIKLIGKYIDMP
jgi:hypothetical protein